MIYFLKNLENYYKLKAKSYKLNAGMTYVELIVVLSIFAVLSSVVVFNYGDFQARVDIKNLASDIALKIVEAQKSALSGVMPSLARQVYINSTWKPSYGVYFFQPATDNKHFVSFVDLGTLRDGLFDGSDCTNTISECLDKPLITKNNTISSLDVCYSSGNCPTINGDLTITFSRPDSGAILYSNGSPLSGISYVQITISSPKGATATIKLYPSGRVQVN